MVPLLCRRHCLLKREYSASGISDDAPKHPWGFHVIPHHDTQEKMPVGCYFERTKDIFDIRKKVGFYLFSLFK